MADDEYFTRLLKEELDMAKFCGFCGKPLVNGKPCGCMKDRMLADKLKERLFPDEIKLCDEEALVKAYHCSLLKSKFLMRTVAYGFLAITNKRVIYHTISIKNDRNFIHNEALIEDISGINLNKGKFFFPSVFINNIYLALSILAVALFILPLFLSNVFNADSIRPFIISCIIIYVVLIILAIYKNREKLIRKFPSFISFLLWFGDLLLGKRTALMFTLISKSGATGPVNLSNLAVLKQTGGWDISAYPEPRENLHEITKDIGTIINDIQKTGMSSAV
jgi:hypothetical protein